MRTKNIFLLLLFLAVPLFQLTAQNAICVVTTTDNVEHSIGLWEDHQMYFDQAYRLVIQNSPNSNHVFPLSEIRKVVFTEITNTEETPTQTPYILPNPTSNHFIVRGLPEVCLGKVIALDGRLVKEFEASEESVIDISGLSAGMYLLNINGQTLKLMKL